MVGDMRLSNPTTVCRFIRFVSLLLLLLLLLLEGLLPFVELGYTGRKPATGLEGFSCSEGLKSLLFTLVNVGAFLGADFDASKL